MRLANLIKHAAVSGAMEEKINDAVKKARIIYFEKVIEDVVSLTKAQWIARLPFPECLINIENKICFLVEEDAGFSFQGVGKEDVMICFTVFASLMDGFNQKLFQMVLGVNKDGVLQDNWNGGRGDLFMRKTDGSKLTEEDRVFGTSLIEGCLGHLTFLNCKNVSLEKIEQASDQVNRKRIRQNKKPLCSYYVASIKGGKSHDGSVPSGDKAHWRFHLCRGHFKQRKTGRFWWSQHARGDKGLGSIVKDYKVDSSVAV